MSDSQFENGTGIFTDKFDFIARYRDLCKQEFGRDFAHCSNEERYYVLARLIAKNARKIRAATVEDAARNEKKQVYYFSMEFLIGRLLEDYILNLGVQDIVCEGLAELGVSYDEIVSQERDPGLGNGGLGRLAACYLDALAHLGINGHGNGIRYRYGLFEQAIVDGCQVEKPDNWLVHGYPWEERVPRESVVVRFGGEVVRHEENGKYWFEHAGGELVVAMPYDVPVVGYGGKQVNRLRLWGAEPYEARLDMDAFNRGDYAGAVKQRSDIEAITAILYPNDSADPGKVLRLKQEYLFVSAGVINILRSFKNVYGDNWELLPEKVAIHTNDTHPALCGVELMRLLLDEEGLDWDVAWDIVTRTISYTNHTIMPEALEVWPIELFRDLLPRIYMLIEEIDHRYRETFTFQNQEEFQLWRDTAILWDGKVKMANLSVICGHAVNGVAKIHSDILKDRVLNSFYRLRPQEFSNKTNGVSHRRFLAESNRPLTKLINSSIGTGWLDDASELEGLLQFSGDASFLEDLLAAKRENKIRLANYVKEKTGTIMDPDSVFDVQVKRFHAYKRQSLNIFKIMHMYEELKAGKTITPTTFVFAGKAAQGYEFAKETIRLINAVADVVNNDPATKDMLRVVFVPNFSVSSGQLIYPAADISEQISTAGFEASGTGNMKFMMNGAVTLGTMDGSTIEIYDLVGKDNISIFGLSSEEVQRYTRERSYDAWAMYYQDERVRRVMDALTSKYTGAQNRNFQLVFDNIMRGNDEFFVLRDFGSYVETWEELNGLCGRRDEFARKSLVNIAKAGFFAADRAIQEYADDIWNI